MSKAPLEIHEGKTKLTNAEEVPATIMRFFFCFVLFCFVFFFFSLDNVGKVIILSYCLNNFIARPLLPRVIAMPV